MLRQIIKKISQKMSQILRENTSAGFYFLLKLQASSLQLY